MFAMPVIWRRGEQVGGGRLRRLQKTPMRRKNMPKLMTKIAAAAAFLAAGAVTNRPDAMPLADPAGIRAALEDISVTEQVHCRPGWWHHWFRPHDGCFRGPFFVGPRFRSRIFTGPRFHPRFVGPRFVGPRFGGGF